MESLRRCLPLVEPTYLLPVLPIVAVINASTYSGKYLQQLGITPEERKRYFGKSRNLALCYVGFAQEAFSLSQARGAGKAVFLSCAYDVISDWDKPPDVKEEFAHILQAESSPRLTRMALDLLERDTYGLLLYDGLERGIVALRFILDMMGLEQTYNKKGADIDRLGINFQIVDDVMDYEEDESHGDQNCLTSPRRNQYLSQLISDLNEGVVKSMFPYGGILKLAIDRARSKADKMLSEPEKYFYDHL